jgi:hypothetical protein
MTLPLKLSAQPAASLATFAPGVQQILQNVIFVGSRPYPVYPDDGVGAAQKCPKKKWDRDYCPDGKYSRQRLSTRFEISGSQDSSAG